MFDSFIKENYKVVDYHVKAPSLREHCLTWRPYRYYKRRKSRAARSRCIALFAAVIIEARPAMNKGEKQGWNLTLTPLIYSLTTAAATH
jgi:hypothetical protein